MLMHLNNVEKKVGKSKQNRIQNQMLKTQLLDVDCDKPDWVSLLFDWINTSLEECISSIFEVTFIWERERKKERERNKVYISTKDRRKNAKILRIFLKFCIAFKIMTFSSANVVIEINESRKKCSIAKKGDILWCMPHPKSPNSLLEFYVCVCSKMNHAKWTFAWNIQCRNWNNIVQQFLKIYSWKWLMWPVS